MNFRIPLSAAAVALLGLTSGAKAGPTAGHASASASATTQRVDVSARLPSRAEFEAVRGIYRLDDGRMLVVSGPRRMPVAELGDASPVALVPLSPTLYAAADGGLRLEFQAHANGLVPAVKVTTGQTTR